METTRLILRERTRERIAEMLTWPQKEQMLFFGFETVKELEAKLARIEKGLANIKVDYRIFDLIEKSTNRVIGSCGFHNWIKDHDRSEMGYALHKKFQRNGYMTEAMKKIIPHGFKNMQLNRLEALIAPDNLDSINLVKRFGFQREGVLRGHYKGKDQFEDSLMYALLKQEYQ